MDFSFPIFSSVYGHRPVKSKPTITCVTASFYFLHSACHDSVIAMCLHPLLVFLPRMQEDEDSVSLSHNCVSTVFRSMPAGGQLSDSFKRDCSQVLHPNTLTAPSPVTPVSFLLVALGPLPGLCLLPTSSSCSLSGLGLRFHASFFLLVPSHSALDFARGDTQEWKSPEKKSSLLCPESHKPVCVLLPVCYHYNVTPH